MRSTTYRAIPCSCWSPHCRAWHVSPVADVPCVSFTQEQAVAVAKLLNEMAAKEEEATEASRG